MRIANLALLTIAFSLSAPAQDVEFHESMQYADKAMAALKKLEKKTGPEAVRSSERIGAIYEQMVNFWRQKGASDAVKWSEAGKAAAVQLATAAHSEDTEKAAASFKTLSDTCTPCHNAHRERIAPGKYRIK